LFWQASGPGVVKAPVVVQPDGRFELGVAVIVTGAGVTVIETSEVDTEREMNVVPPRIVVIVSVIKLGETVTVTC